MRLIIFAFIGLAAVVGFFLIRFLLRDFGVTGKPKRPQALPQDAPEAFFAELRQRRQSRSPSFELVKDPREAATILLVEMARASGELNMTQIARIDSMIEQTFSFPPSMAAELLSQARWVSGSEQGETAMWKRMTQIVVKHVATRAIIEFDELLVEMSEFGNVPTTDQLRLLSTFRKEAGIDI